MVCNMPKEVWLYRWNLNGILATVHWHRSGRRQNCRLFEREKPKVRKGAQEIRADEQGGKVVAAVNKTASLKELGDGSVKQRG